MIIKEYRARNSVKALITNKQGFVLCVQTLQGEWSLPGGTLEEGELPLDALRRELHEELGLICELGELLVLRADKKGLHLVFAAQLPEGATIDDVVFQREELRAAEFFPEKMALDKSEGSRRVRLEAALRAVSEGKLQFLSGKEM
jgi:ADP-ribose pyrophosphatase YjhB (NUDIX family)